jgi:hypothetical protein
MSPFREALKVAGHGEWIVDAISTSGDVSLRKIKERGLEVRLPIGPSEVRLAIAPFEDGIAIKAAA